MQNKPRIALIVDQDDWAFANICNNFTPFLSEKYDFDIIPVSYASEGIISILIFTKDYDITHFFWRGLITEIDLDITRKKLLELGTTMKRFKRDYLNNKIITTSIYDHLYSTNNDINFIENYLKFVKEYTVSSNKLFDIYNDLSISKKPLKVITDGINLSKFKCINSNRFDDINKRKIKIGWVGNSAWADASMDYKGVHTILKPAVEELINEGYPLEMYFADKQERMIPHEKMPQYYNEIDIYVCTSLTEGTPNPVLESMACGVPIISTNVGIVEDVLGDKQKKYILEERTKECLKEKIKKLVSNSNEFITLSKENLEMIKTWKWENISNKFDDFFAEILKNKGEK